MVLPTTYWGPEEWYRRVLMNADAEVEVMESFVKQTYRNRCTILTPNGEQTLSVPVKKVESKQYTRDVMISYQSKWQHQHWMAIMSAYKHTPYFDYYQDYVRVFYEREFERLTELNDGIHGVAMSLLMNEPPRSDAKRYLLKKTTDWSGLDLEASWGDGLSILDALFRWGPEAKIMLLSKLATSK